MYLITTDFIVKKGMKQYDGLRGIHDERMNEILGYLMSNFNREISLSELAEHLYLSVPYLSKYIKKNFGMSFLKLLNNIRLEKAVSELLYTDKTVLKIAMECGFSNMAGFNHVFKESYHMNPTEYRLQAQDRIPKREEVINSREILEKVEQYLSDNLVEAPETDNPAYSSLEVDKNNRRPLKKNWCRLINIGSAPNLLRYDVRRQVTYLKENLSLEYVRFWNLLSEEMMINLEGPRISYNFALIDQILDFLVAIHVKPHIELNNKGDWFLKKVQREMLQNKYHSRIHLLENNMVFLEEFIRHLVRRYGPKEVGSWYFELEKNSVMQHEVSTGQYLRVFAGISRLFKTYASDVKVGGAGFTVNMMGKQFSDILKAWKKNGVLPDFLSIYSYPYLDVSHMGFSEISGKFFHYVLGKMGASAGHLDPKKKGRTLCEACGAYGWKFGVRDMKWLLDHLMVQGVNYFVPHAFSMAEYPDPDCPPHFYARGNNPQYRHFAELMKYTNRMCELLNGGKHGARAAVLYQAEAEWMGDYMDMADAAKVLSNNQVDFDFIPIDALENMEEFNGNMSLDGKTLSLNGQSFMVLFVPYSQYIPKALDDFIKENPDFDVCFIEGYPKAVISPYEKEGTGAFIKKGKVISITDLASYGKEKAASITLEKDFPSMLVYDYEKNGKIYMLFNSDMYQAYEGDVFVEGEKDFILYDGLKNCCVKVPCCKEGGKTRIRLKLPIYHSCLLIEKTKDMEYGRIEPEETEDFKKEILDLSRNWKVSSCRSIAYPSFGFVTEADELEPYSEKHPEFSGYIRYEKEFELPAELEKAKLTVEYVYECMELWLDGVNYGKCICPPYEIELGRLTKGKHTLRIEAATTLDREQQTFPKPPFQYIFEPMEPTGIFGRIALCEDSICRASKSAPTDKASMSCG